MTWVVRGHYPSGDMVEEFATEEAAQEAIQRHRASGVPVAVRSPAPPGTVVPNRCSFCGKDRGAVEHLIAGPAGAGVAICNQCIALCNEILKAR